ncbi:P-loop containing nucleoside triphosphate hydrolase protein [Amylocystis lapponica]|nr:P-loop containing nucleoside triphosphate hydrolase protein [Amylocystis lapponica]
MRLACLLRNRRRLLMQLDPSRRSSPFASSSGSSSLPSLKRPYAQAAHATAPSPFEDDPTSSGSAQRLSSPPDSERPVKVPKIESTDSPSTSSSAMHHSAHSHSRQPSLLARMHASNASHSGSGGKGRSSRGRGGGTATPQQTFTGPRTYKVKPLKSQWEENPKSPLANFLSSTYNKQPAYECVQGVGANGQIIWRTVIRLQEADLNVTANGDHTSRKESEKLAALCAMYQIDAMGVFSKPSKQGKKEQGKKETSKKEAEIAPSQVKLSDGSVVDYERARQFMDYYCRRFGFGKPDISYTDMHPRGGGTIWQADMTVGGRRIGFGKGVAKKAAMSTCYVDVTQYLESCDAGVWQQFLMDAKSGKDLGMAPRVLFQIDDALEDQVQDLCEDIKRSTLYRHRPKIGSHKTGEDAPDAAGAQPPSAPRMLYRRPVPPGFYEGKSEQMRARREQYLQDPALAKMRETRAGLPVYTKAEELLKHVRENEVTICMAATGSGKTTQIPQLILDEWIDKGEGAKCNVVCTQPRRIAAISVADRVAKERGETAGRTSSVGYQVRFESNLPDEHGTITYCTTGIFLKRMQSALLGDSASSRSLDDVTHIVVDEVHERDVDTDLLLVVLKRLITDRKARNKPIKIVLMSATIDPTLFRQYFPDESGRPASVIEIPGRAFPVAKNFLDDFVPQLAQNRETSWVFQEQSVAKYLTHQMGSAAPVPMYSRDFKNRSSNDADEPPKDDDLDLPIPLIALTIAHVLRSSDDGHVLVFLPGWDEIMKVQKCLCDSRPLLGINFNDLSKIKVHILHSTIPIAEQQAIFEPPPVGVRRVILATNIAETSVTIPDVVYVVDTAKIKEQRYDPERHISSLVSAWVGSSNLNQRAGRAGRHRPGEYFGILSRQHAEALHPYQTVEMKRVDLSNVVMHVKALNFPGVPVEQVLAETIEPPAAERVVAAMKQLQMVGALDAHNNLTSLGRVLLQLPVDVQMGRLVLFGSFFRCLDQALTLAAILTNRDPFVAPMHLKIESAAKKNSWSPEEFRSDALATLRAYNAWWDLQKRGHYVTANKFCSDNFLAKPTLLMIQKIKAQLLQSLYTSGVIEVSAGGDVGAYPSGPRRGDASVPPELDSNADSFPLLAALIAIASQPNYAIRTSEKGYRTAQDKMVLIHPSSVNHRKREIVETDNDSAPTEKQIIAFAEKRQNISGGSNAMTYILFGAYEIQVTARGLECDGQDALDDVERLKVLMESCMLRESSLSPTEIKELDMMTRDIVRILNHYSTYRVAMQSHHNSRPATPMDSPMSSSGRLPPLGGSRSGYSTPHYMGSSYNSRPSTPSRLSRRL